MNEFDPPGTVPANAPVMDPAGPFRFIQLGNVFQWSIPPENTKLQINRDVVVLIEEDLRRKAATERQDEFGGLLLGEHSTNPRYAYHITAIERCRCQVNALHRVLALWSDRWHPNRIDSTESDRAANLRGVVGFYRILGDQEVADFNKSDRELSKEYAAYSRFFLIHSSGSLARAFVRKDSGFTSCLIDFPASLRNPEPREIIVRRAVDENSRLASEFLCPAPSLDPARRIPPTTGTTETTPSSGQFSSNPPNPVSSTPVALDDTESLPELEYEDLSEVPVPPSGVRARRWSLWLILIAAILLASAVIWALRKPGPASIVSKSPTPDVFELDIRRLESGILLTWNPASESILSARAGLITIQDGGKQQEMPLERDQLLSGKLFYPPLSESVKFTFKIFTDKGVLEDYVTGVIPRDTDTSTDLKRVPTAPGFGDQGSLPQRKVTPIEPGRPSAKVPSPSEPATVP